MGQTAPLPIRRSKASRIFFAISSCGAIGLLAGVLPYRVTPSSDTVEREILRFITNAGSGASIEETRELIEEGEYHYISERSITYSDETKMNGCLLIGSARPWWQLKEEEYPALGEILFKNGHVTSLSLIYANSAEDQKRWEEAYKLTMSADAATKPSP